MSESEPGAPTRSQEVEAAETAASAQAAPTPLPHHRYQGSNSDNDHLPPVVFLHGFGGDGKSWLNLQTRIASHRSSIAFDLPGHGKAVNWPEIGNAGIAAKHVSRSLKALNLGPVHLVGHSMGGAVAALIALRTPDAIASLTLLAPGGFGPQINASLLTAFARGTTEETLSEPLAGMFNPDFRMPKFLKRAAAMSREIPGQTDALLKILESITDGQTQKTLPLDDLAQLPMEKTIVWGREDDVVPVTQAESLSDRFDTHLLEGIGHMPHLEAPAEVSRLLVKKISNS